MGAHVKTTESKDHNLVLERFSKCAANGLGCLQSSDKIPHKNDEMKGNNHI